MFESMKRRNKRAILILLIIVLVSAQFILIGKYGLEGLISYATETGEGSVTLDFEVENINKANIGSDGTGSYGEMWILNLIPGTGLPTSISMTTPEKTTFYKTEITQGGDFVALTDVASVYANTGLFKEQLTGILVNSADNGAEGKLQIKNADTNAVLFEVTESNIAEKEDFITFTYSANISKISIVLENINTEAESLTIIHSKYVSGIKEDYINNDTISKIESKLNFVAGTTNETYTEESYVLRTTKASFEIDNNNTTSNKKVDNKNTLFLGTTNDVKFTIDLHTESEEYELYSNPSFVILFPNDYVKTASMFDEEGKVDLTITGDFKLSEYAVQTIDALGATAVAFSLEGTQTDWGSSAEQNASLELNVSLELEDKMPETTKPITLYYKNSGLTQYEPNATNEESITCGKLTQDITLDDAVSVDLQNMASIGGIIEDNDSDETNYEEEITPTIEEGKNVDYILSVEISKETELADGKIIIKNILPEELELAIDADGNYEIYDRDSIEEKTITNTDEETGETSTVTVKQEQKLDSSLYTYNEETRELIITLDVDKSLPIIENEDETIIGSITKNIRIIATVGVEWKEQETFREIKNKIDVILANENLYLSNEPSFIAKSVEGTETTTPENTEGGEANETGISAYMQSSSSTWTSTYSVPESQSITLSKIKSSSSIFCRERGGTQGSLSHSSYSRGSTLYTNNNNKYSYILSYPWYASENSGSLTNQKIQCAIWTTGSSGLCVNDRYTGGSSLYNTAVEYQNYMKNNNVKNEINGENAVFNQNGTVGPFELNYYAYEGFGGIKNIVAYGGATKETANTKITKTVNGNKLWDFVDSNGNVISKPDGTSKFYIKIYNMDYLTDNNIFFIKLVIVFNSDKETHSEHYTLEGTGYYTYNYTPYCSTCRSIINSAYSYGGYTYLKYGGAYYKLSHTGTYSNIGSNPAGTFKSGTYLQYYGSATHITRLWCYSGCGKLGDFYDGDSNLYSVATNHARAHSGHSTSQLNIYQGTIYNYSKVTVGCGAYSDEGYCGHTYYGNTTYDLQKLLQVQKRQIITTTDTAYIEFPVAVTVGGNVWEDGQTGVKPTKAANGKIDSGEAKVSQVKVSLYKADGTQVTTNAYGQSIGTNGYIYTDENGYYEFKDIKADINGYYVKFEYDGVNYIATEYGEDSVGQEKDDDREKLNSNFEIIKVGKTGTGKELTYTYSKGEEHNISKLNTLASNNSAGKKYPVKKSDTELAMGDVASNFKMTAISPIYKVTNRAVNFGIVRRGVDLNLLTNLVTADVNVNDETTVYEYKQRGEDGVVELGEAVTSTEIAYNLAIDYTDYNFRIDSYGDIGVDVSATGEVLDKEKVKDVDIENLNIIATYKIELNNNSEADAKVNSIDYYYDANYTFIKGSESYEKYNSAKNKDLGSITITEASGTTTIKGHQYKKLTITGLATGTEDQEATLNGGEQNIITLKFSINAKNTGDLETGEFMMIGEITSYSSSEGYVDDDSAPGNITRIDDGWFEDDTDKAGTLTIEVTDKPQRELSGFVFEDSKTEESEDTVDGKTYTHKAGDGIYDEENEDEKKVNGVIVQLVERVIMPIWIEDGITYTSDKKLAEDNGYKLLDPEEMPQAEYIWQETVSGSSKVRKISYDGTKIETYDVGEVGRGEYKFVDYIPGVYIIRFVYGDGTTIEKSYKNYEYGLDAGENADMYSIEEEVAKYNGQAYKSTTDSSYKNEWSNPNSGTRNPNSSIARDNEARRLETIIKIAEITQQEATATVTEIDGRKQVQNLGIFDLEEVWMCAETSKINVSVFMSNTYRTPLENEVPGTYYLKGTDNWVKDETEQVFKNVNFGLEERAKNEIYLEKHIESLKVTLQDGTDVVNVSIDLEDYYNGDKTISELDRMGISKGLSIVGATRNDPGYWQVDIDDEIIHGGKIELVYRYSVQVKGDQDYLSEELADIYIAEDGEKYISELIETISKDIKPARYWDAKERKEYNISEYIIGEYLGSTYYTGILDLKNGTANVDSDSEVKPVTAKVLSIVDFVNNDLKFVDEENDNMMKIAEDDIHFPSGEKHTYVVIDSEGLEDQVNINTILRSEEPSEALTVGDIDYKYSAKFVYEGLSPTGVLEFPAYYSQVASYISPTGKVIEGSATYLPFAYSNVTPGSYGLRTLEIDEAWAEKLILVKPTGEDEITKLILAITITVGVLIVAGGAFAIKKYVIK